MAEHHRFNLLLFNPVTGGVNEYCMRHLYTRRHSKLDSASSAARNQVKTTEWKTNNKLKARKNRYEVVVR